MSPVDDDAATLFHQFQLEGSLEARNELIVKFHYIVEYVARKLEQRLVDSIEYDDLVGYGTIGLIDALERFNVDRGVKFTTYAVPRIRGAIIDELRSMDWVPRSVRARASRIDKARQVLESRLNRMPTDAELADMLEMDETDIAEVRKDVDAGHILGYERIDVDENGDVTVADMLDDHTVDPTVHAHEHDLREMLINGVSWLDERERTIVALHYIEGLTLADIGVMLQVTESRVCQLHTRAIEVLRAARPETLV